MVVYFSATGTTEKVALKFKEELKLKAYRITPGVPYSSDDLNWHDDRSRANREQSDDTARPVIAWSLPDLAQVDTVYLGAPLWWGRVPRIVQTFIEQVDLTGKKVYFFCTSGSSPIAPALEYLKAEYPRINWQGAKRFEADAQNRDVLRWVESTAQ